MPAPGDHDALARAAEVIDLLVREGLLERIHSSRGYTYRVTPKGDDVWPVLAALGLSDDQHITAPARSRPPGGGCATPSF